MTDTLYSASGSDASGFALTRFISLLGVEPVTTGTFAPAPGAPLASAWEIWQKEFFLPYFAPAFVRSYHAAAAFHIAEIAEEDRALDARLPEAIRRKSVLAGKPFLEGKSEMRGHREWTRFAEQVNRGDSPGHLCVLFALQSLLFHLPLQPALTACAAFEFQSRSAAFPFPEISEDENTVFDTILPRISLAVRNNASEHDGKDGKLRVI